MIDKLIDKPMSGNWKFLIRAHTFVLAAVILVITVLTIGATLVMGHEASVKNIYDELLLEGPECTFHVSLPGKGSIAMPRGFETHDGGVDRISSSYRSWTYEGNKLGRLLASKLYESDGLYLSLRRSPHSNAVEIYADSGLAIGRDGNGYGVKVDWTYTASNRTLIREITFLRDNSIARKQISAKDFFSGAGLDRNDVERWANHALNDLVIKEYFEANKGHTRFTENNPGSFTAADTTDWGSKK